MKNIPFNTGLLNVKRLNDRNRSDASEDNHYESFSFRLFLSSPERKAEERRCADIVSPPRNWDGVLRAVIYDRGYEKGGGRLLFPLLCEIYERATPNANYSNYVTRDSGRMDDNQRRSSHRNSRTFIAERVYVSRSKRAA